MGGINETKEREAAARERDRARTLIYVILTECTTSSRGTSQAFISGHNHSEQAPFDNTGELKSLKDILDFFAYEHLTPVYDAANLSAAIGPIKPGARNAHISPKTRLQARLKSMGFADKEDFAVDHPTCHLDGIDVTTTILSHMVARKAIGNSVALLNLGGFKRHDSSIVINDTHKSQTVTINIITDIKAMHKWLSCNRNPKRKYTFNPKHGDISKAARTGYAQLKTSEADTTRLLSLAVGNDKQSTLWYYDDERGEYIYFENQQESRPNFHGYHVKKGEKNYDKINFEKLRKVQTLP